jgi:hypothetical protein
LILCALMNLTISAASINLSVSMLFRILHVFQSPFIMLKMYNCR